MCRPVMTDLANDLMPFIRYCQGDWLELAADPTADRGRWRSIRNIQGRDDDSATLPGGQKVRWHPFYEVMDRYIAIRQFRIVQHQVDQFEVLVAAEADYVQAIRHELLVNLSRCFPQHPIQYTLTRVDQLEPDPSGKLRMLVSEIG